MPFNGSEAIFTECCNTERGKNLQGLELKKRRKLTCTSFERSINDFTSSCKDGIQEATK